MLSEPTTSTPLGHNTETEVVGAEINARVLVLGTALLNRTRHALKTTSQRHHRSEELASTLKASRGYTHFLIRSDA